MTSAAGATMLLSRLHGDDLYDLTTPVKRMEHVGREYFGRVGRVQTRRADRQGIQLGRQMASDLKSKYVTQSHRIRHGNY